MSSIHEYVKVGSDKMTSFLFSSIVQRYSLIHSFSHFVYWKRATTRISSRSWQNTYKDLKWTAWALLSGSLSSSLYYYAWWHVQKAKHLLLSTTTGYLSVSFRSLAWLPAVHYVGVSISRLLRSLTDNHLVVSKGGLGRPIASLTPSETSTFLQVLMATMITYSLTITSVKISLLLLYRRIFNTTLFKKQSLIVGIACIVWLVVEMSLNIFQCTPFSAAFQPAYLFTDRCIDLQAFYWGVTVTNLLLDVVVLLLPMQVVWKLKLPKRQKITLSAIFLSGGL